MSTTYAQRQTTAQKKDASSASSVLDNSSQSESLQRKADMANNNIIQCYEMTPNFRDNHTGSIDDTVVRQKVKSRNEEDSSITKNSVLMPDAANTLKQYSEELDGHRNKWQPIRNVPCVTASLNGDVEQEQVSVWLTDETDARLGHVDENDVTSIKKGGILKFRTKIKSCEYSGIKNAVDSRKLPTVPQKPEDPYQKIVEKLQSGLESVFFGCIADDGYFVIEGSPICYEMNKIIKFFEDFSKDEKKQLYLDFTEKDTDKLCAIFKEKLPDKWSSFFEGSLKIYYTPSVLLEGIYELDETSVDLTCVWSFYKDTLKECGKTL